MLPRGERGLGRAQRLLARGRHELAEELADLRFGKRARELRDGAAVFERDDVRDRADVECLRKLGIVVGVDLHELDSAAERFGDLVERRPERAARAAPGCPEIDDDGCEFRGFDDLAFESGGADVHVRIVLQRLGGRGRGAAVLASYAHGFAGSRAWGLAHASSAFGVAVVAVLGVAVVWSGAARGRIRRRPAVRSQEPELAGYAPTAPATGSMLRYDTEYPDDSLSDGPAHRSRRRADRPDRARRGDARVRPRARLPRVAARGARRSIPRRRRSCTRRRACRASSSARARRARSISTTTSTSVRAAGAPIEIASLDPNLGPVFYLLEQTAAARPTFSAELGRCLSCHDSYSLTGGGVPRFIVGSGYTGTTGMLVSHEGWILISDRTPLKSRWGGWYVTGQHGDQVHLGNMVIKTLYDFDRLEELRVGNIDTLDGLFDVQPYLTNKSDIVALLVLQHQADVQNLITRVSYDARTAEDKREEPLDETIERLLRMMLFVDAVEYTAPISGEPKFVEQFERRARARLAGPIAARFRSHAASVPLSVELRHLLARVRCAAGRGQTSVLSAPERGAERCRRQRGLRALDRRRPRRDCRDSPRHEARLRGRRSQLKSWRRAALQAASAARP